MSAKGRPEREYRSAKHEGTSMSAAGEAKARTARRRAIACARLDTPRAMTVVVDGAVSAWT
jgi:hypothetical protein